MKESDHEKQHATNTHFATYTYSNGYTESYSHTQATSGFTTSAYAAVTLIPSET